MKKSLLISMVVFMGLVSFAQKANFPIPQVNPKISQKSLKTRHAVSDLSDQQNTPAAKPNFKPLKKSNGSIPQVLSETQIGTTTYDLQTNGSVANRLVANSNGTIQATWTFSNIEDAAWADRGAGYNYNNGTSWGAFPTARVEGSTRTGWPEIITLANGTEVIISHAPGDNSLVMSTRNPLGSGTWDVNPLTVLAPNSILWPRAASGGPDGNTIHLIALNDQATVLNGVTGAVSYSRSTDGGLTWDIKSIQIPGLDSSNYRSMGGDGYAISARGNDVAVVNFGSIDRTVLAKSTDNGATWTSSNIFDIPFIYDNTSTSTTGWVQGWSGDSNGDGFADTLTTTDNSGTIIIDLNGTAHIFWGVMNNLDDAADGQPGSWFPGTNGLAYWNEKMGNIEPQIVGAALDLDGSGTLLDNIADPGTELGLYYSSLSAQPNAGVDANNCLYIVYTAVMEIYNSGSQYYRHVYASKSCDNGCTWSFPIDMTPSDEFAECVFPSMAHNVGSEFNFIYQKDEEPGLNVRGDADAYDGTPNEIWHVKDNITRLDTVAGFCIGGIDAPTFVFCSGDSVLVTATCGTAWAWSNGATTQTTYAKTYGTLTCDITTACPYQVNDSLSFSSPTTAPVVSVVASAMTACPGDSVYLSTDLVTSASFQWSTGDTTPTTVVTNTGTYTVTVTNCGGQTVASVTISSPSAPTVMATADTMFACPGDSVTLTTNSVTGASWAWSTGDSTQTIIVTSIDTFIVTVTNCGGSTADTVMITLPPAPVAAITGGLYLCAGDTITINATVGNKYSYLWSTGDTLSSIDVDSIGTYSVTITNCGGVDSVSVDVTTTPLPAPAIQLLGNDSVCQGVSAGLVATGATTYQWSSGETTNTISVTVGGPYTVTGYNACFDSVVSASVTIVVIPLPPVPGVTCFSSGSQWGFACLQCDSIGTNQWYLNNNPMNGKTDDTLLVEWSTIGNGTVTVKATNFFGCSSTSPNITCFVGMEETIPGSAISIYPNPNDGQFGLTFNNMENGKYSISVKNILGQVVYTKKISLNGNYRMNMDLSEFKSGVYFLTVANSEGEQTQKVIVR